MFNDSLTLGTLRGIRVGVHWSVLFIASLLAWSLASGLLPAAAPGLDPLTYWLAGIGVAAAFFGSLLLHELAHAVFARRAGMRVEGITLWLLGGVAKFHGEAPTPAHDLRIAASGPIVSGLLGVLCWAGALGASASGAPAILEQALLWLARVNLVLAAFNLLPGAPLDGGRIVRALAWRAGRDRLRASLLATRLGRVIGYGLVAFGVLELVAGTDVGGLWTIVLGLFLATAASAESTHEVARTALGGVRVSEVMTPDPVRVPAGISVDVFAEGVLAAQRQAAALVVEPGGAITGVAGISEVAGLRGPARRDRRVRDIALPLSSVPSVGPEEDLLEAMQRVAAEETAATARQPWGGAGRRANPGYLLVVAPGDRPAQAADDGAPMAPPPPPGAPDASGRRAPMAQSILGIVTPADLARTVERRAPGAAVRGEARQAP